MSIFIDIQIKSSKYLDNILYLQNWLTKQAYYRWYQSPHSTNCHGACFAEPVQAMSRVCRPLGQAAFEQMPNGHRRRLSRKGEKVLGVSTCLMHNSRK